MEEIARDLKEVFSESWRIVESFFRQQHSPSYKTLVLETWIVSNPILLHEGFLVFEEGKNRGLIIHSIDDLACGKPYISEKGTKLFKTSTEIVLGDLIKVPLDTENSNMCLKGIFNIGITTVAVEFFTRRKIEDGILLYYDDPKSKILGRKIRITSLYDLQPQITYSCHSSDGVLQITFINPAEIDFFFESIHKQNCSNIPTVTISQSLSPVKPTAPASNSEPCLKNSPFKKVDGRVTFDEKTSVGITNFEGWEHMIEEEGANLNFKECPSPENNPNLLISQLSEIKISDTQANASFLNTKASRVLDFSDPSSPKFPKTAASVPNFGDRSIPAPPPFFLFGVPPPLSPMHGTKTASAIPKKKLRSLLWTPLTNTKTKSTFWDQNHSELLELTDINEDLEHLFALSPVKKPVVPKNKIKTAKSLFTVKRNRNVGILLAHFKISLQQLKEAILQLDENILTIPRLESLSSIIPDAEERQTIAQFKGNLAEYGETERFFSIVFNIPHLEARVRFLLYKLELPSVLLELETNIEALSLACEEVRKGEKFSKLLKMVLALGSKFHTGSTSSVAGFKLDGLLKLQDTKSKDNQTTLLHYLKTLIQTKVPELLDFSSQLPHIERASKISLEFLQKNLKELVQTSSDLETELQSCTLEEKENDCFYFKMKEFHSVSSQNLLKVKANLDKTTASFITLAQYFAEDSSNSEHFFSTLFKFCQSFNKIQTKSTTTTSTTNKLCNKRLFSEANIKGSNNSPSTKAPKSSSSLSIGGSLSIQSSSSIEKENVKNRITVPEETFINEITATKRVIEKEEMKKSNLNNAKILKGKRSFHSSLSQVQNIPPMNVNPDGPHSNYSNDDWEVCNSSIKCHDNGSSVKQFR